jgi:hypothetical protein
MTEEQLDRMVRDADPYRPVGHLDGAREALLEEIMSDRTVRFRLAPRLAAALVAAAVLVVALAVSAWPRAKAGEQRAATPPATADGQHATGSAGSPIVFTPAAMKAAEENPRLLIEGPGWKITTVYGFTEKSGTIAFQNGGREAEINWYPADGYEPRTDVSKPEPVTVAGLAAQLFTYSADDYAVQLPPRPGDGAYAEIRAQGWNRSRLEKDVLAHVVRADVRTFLAAMPPEVVIPGREQKALAEVIADIPLPPGFDTATVLNGGANDPYQFGATVTGPIGCAWIAEWRRADKAGDTAARDRATAALRGSHKWQVLLRMDPQGGWSTVFWEYADRTVAGDPPSVTEVNDGLGCG